ncbi:MAG: hypothetical protein J6Y81_05565 [Ruminococcus sp.]|nr:hypothetical protein [Ruminococcus sp.]
MAEISTRKIHLTFYASHTTMAKQKSGKYTIGHKISKKKKKVIKAKLKTWIKANRNLDCKIFLQTLDRKLTGTNNYYGISGEFSKVGLLYAHA